MCAIEGERGATRGLPHTRSQLKNRRGENNVVGEHLGGANLIRFQCISQKKPVLEVPRVDWERPPRKQTVLSREGTTISKRGNYFRGGVWGDEPPPAPFPLGLRNFRKKDAH